MQREIAEKLSIINENVDRTGQSQKTRRWYQKPRCGPRGRRSMRRTSLGKLRRMAMDIVSSEQNIMVGLWIGFA